MQGIMKAKDSVPLLIQRAQDGERAAFDRLIERYEARLRALVSSRMGTHVREVVEVDDVVQDTLVRAFQSIDRFEWNGRESFLRWLGAIAENVILNTSKKRTRAPHLRLRRDVAASGASPSRTLRRDERFERLETSLKGLSEDHRKVILLARIDGLPIKTIAQKMNRSESAVKNLLLRALRGLKTSFGDTGSLNLPERRLEMEETGHDE